MSNSTAVKVVAGLLAVLLITYIGLSPSLVPANLFSETDRAQVGKVLERLASGLLQLWVRVTHFLATSLSALLSGAPSTALPPSDGSSSLEHSQPRTATGGSITGFAWDHEPLTIAIQLEDGVDPGSVAFVKAAISEWQNMLRSRLNLTGPLPLDRPPFGIRYVEGSKADIVIILKRETAGKNLGETSVTYSDGVIRSVRIEMAVNNVLGFSLDRADVENIAAHEFGHALGLGHSANPEDLMYSQYNFLQVSRTIPPSACDVSTLLTGYKADGFGAPNDPSALSTFSCS